MSELTKVEMPQDLADLSHKVQAKKVTPINAKTANVQSIQELKKLLSKYQVPDEEKKMHPSAIATVLMSQWYFKLIGTSRDYSILYAYNPETGIYDSSMNFISNLCVAVEFRSLMTDWKNVVEVLRVKAPLETPVKNKHLIAVGNGIFNTKTKILEPFSPEYAFTSKVKTNYNPEAKLTMIDGWNVEEWLLSLVEGDSEMVELLYQMINEAINPNHTRKKIGFLVGEGNSGKGTFQQLLINLIGFQNVSTLKIDEFGGDSNRFKKSMLDGKTLNIGDDISRTPVNTVSDLMSIATGDPITLEIKNGAIYSVQLSLFCLFSGNEMPNVSGNKSSGWYRRLLIIPFNANFNGEKENPKIKEQYIANQEVLEYVLYKAINLDFEKFNEPHAVEEALQSYKSKNDTIRNYVIDRFIADNLTHYEKLPIKFLKSDYAEFLQENRMRSAIPYGFVGELVNNLNELTEFEYEEKPTWFNSDYIGTLEREISEGLKAGTIRSIVKNNLQAIT